MNKSIKIIKLLGSLVPRIFDLIAAILSRYLKMVGIGSNNDNDDKTSR